MIIPEQILVNFNTQNTYVKQSKNVHPCLFEKICPQMYKTKLTISCNNNMYILIINIVLL